MEGEREEMGRTGGCAGLLSCTPHQDGVCLPLLRIGTLGDGVLPFSI